ncbi:hypothetical protein HZH66_007911 [Vespula vulgaris]|uniref:Uncharacterized protein n=1 Tax=Vespula vulgaris TaxID=7454 RepID=A0A834JW24_VESVU|nr:hypothetical protein HZH66_007911 [Vespula vulgaris]
MRRGREGDGGGGGGGGGGGSGGGVDDGNDGDGGGVRYGAGGVAPTTIPLDSNDPSFLFSYVFSRIDAFLRK